MGRGGSRKGSWDTHSGDSAWLSPSIHQLPKEDGKGRGTKNTFVLPGSLSLSPLGFMCLGHVSSVNFLGLDFKPGFRDISC